MDLLFTIIDIILFILLFGIPFLFLWFARKSKLNYNFGFYFLFAFLTTIIFVFFLAWFGYISNEILLNYYGYNFDAMSSTERYKNISVENIEKVYSLEKNRSGIGWPLKAIFGSFLFLAYTFLTYFICFLIIRKK